MAARKHDEVADRAHRRIFIFRRIWHATSDFSAERFDGLDTTECFDRLDTMERFDNLYAQLTGLYGRPR